MVTWTMQMMLKRWSEPVEKSCFTLNHDRGKIDAETSLIKGGGGDFDVYVDSVLIFSKKKEGRFPNEGEVERLIKNQSWSGFLS